MHHARRQRLHLVLVAGTLRPILETDKREARVLAAAAEVEAADREYRLHGLLLVVQQIFADLAQRFVGVRDGRAGRSEEHTSELQSLMRISYAVFCLKKQNNTT